MVATAPPIQQSLVGEKRVTLRGLTWQGYQQILHALPESRAARLTYDHGILEISMPLESHEFALRLIERFIIILIFEMGMKIKTMGSTTAKVAGRKVNLAEDPAPDIVVEVDITHTDIDKNRLYAAIDVPEFWSYNGQEWRIYQLQEKTYQECDRSPTFPGVKKEYLYNFLAKAQQDEIEAEKEFRSLIQEKIAEKSL